MSQILALGQNRYITIDRSWSDGGLPARYGIVGGQMVLMTTGQKPRPDILQAGTEFFYRNGLPVTKAEDVSHLDEPYLSQALAFINKGEPKAAQVFATQEEAAAPKRGRGRPKKVEATTGPRKIAIHDEESLLAVAGYSDEPGDE